MPRVLIAEKVCDQAQAVLKNKGIDVVYMPKISRDELLAIIGDYDGLIVRSQPVVDGELLEAAHKLKVVGRAGNGVDNIDMECATDRGIIVVNTPDANSVSAAELTMGMIIASSRHIPQANASLKAGVWGRSRFQGSELRNKTVGIIGLGRIGSLVAQRLNAFEVKVIAYDPYITDASFARVDAIKCETLADLLAEADLITIHTPKTEETVNMINDKELALAKDGVRIVNCARGGLINEDTILKGLKSGKIASAACDVLTKEPCTEHPLYEEENFIVTPHIGATTDEAQLKVGLTIANEVAAALTGDIVPNAVNMPLISKSDLTEIRPYLHLAENLGKIYHQMEKTPVEKVEIVYCGDVAEMETEVLTLAVLKGVFEPILKERVNYVNARLTAEAREVAVAETREDLPNRYGSLIKVRIIAGGNIYQYAGTVFGRDEARIVEIAGYTFDFSPTENMVVLCNYDAPGLIGRIGLTMGDYYINIGTMQVSRKTAGGVAMMLMSVDSKVKKEYLESIAAIKGVTRVHGLEM